MVGALGHGVLRVGAAARAAPRVRLLVRLPRGSGGDPCAEEAVIGGRIPRRLPRPPSCVHRLVVGAPRPRTTRPDTVTSAPRGDPIRPTDAGAA
ncbi:hypothetical protein ACFSM7_13060 [Clavibacter michiganensis subsp. tessellarius]|uniref:hypothetical protein n=1 Tax=Clavibacter tessellarius TaxID=31965 RepID=UPI00362F993C